jgi:outer membrane receptor protein involved in Fe transport
MNGSETGHGGAEAGRMLLRSTVCAVAVVAACTAPAQAQQRPAPTDTVVSLDALVVTADRAETPLAASVASVSRLTAAQLARIPQLTLADALRQVPGFALVSFDGLGYDPQLMVRGFYGGGEAEYVVVLLDGRPVNALHGGGIAWDALPLASTAVVEIVRGGASALYGDAALAGVINIITREPRGSALRAGVAHGTFGTWRTQLDAQHELFGRGVSTYGGGERTDGFRDHADRTTWHAGASAALLSGERAGVTLSALGHRRDFAEPGPLLAAALAQDRSMSDTFFRFDRTRDDAVRSALDVQLGLGTTSRITGSLSGEHRSTRAVRTIALSPEFADTKERVLRADRVGGTVQLAIDDTPAPLTDRLIAGVDASYGWLDSDYYDVLTGPRATYQAASGARGQLDTSGAGSRAAVAAFAHYSLAPVEPVRLSVGARADWLRDSFAARTPDAERTHTTHEAFSPKAGINVQYLRRQTHTGHAYASVSRSFKAPTLDQLYDLRRIPVPFPPFAITTSNPALAPQHGTSIEAGLYHGLTLRPGTLSAELSVAAYEMRMQDELDFDVQTLRYVNIGSSKHRGVETGVRVNATSGGSAFVNYTLQRVTAEVGPNAGRYLKAIPRHTFSGGITVTPLGQLEAGAFASHNRDIFLDDANTIELPDYTRVDARLAYGLRGVRLFVDVRNVFDAEYSTTGFPDPSGSGAIYYYPAAGRSFEIGIRGGR